MYIDKDEADPLLLFYHRIDLSKKKGLTIRYVFNLLDLIGMIGGIASVILIFFSTILGPFAEHSFVLKAIQSLFVVKKTAI